MLRNAGVWDQEIDMQCRDQVKDGAADEKRLLSPPTTGARLRERQRGGQTPTHAAQLTPTATATLFTWDYAQSK